MGGRIAAPKHLGELLTEQLPRMIKRNAYQPLMTTRPAGTTSWFTTACASRAKALPSPTS
jgi:hypothetical protein